MTHGDIKEITFNHPTLGQGVFFPKAGEGNTMDPGGIRTADDANSIAGNGDLIKVKNRVAGMFEVVCENDMNDRQDVLTAAALAADSEDAEWTFDLINGTVWQCSGPVVGDIQPDVNAGTFTLKVAAGVITRIV